MEIPGFKIDRVIAEGGMSSVYLALQESLGRRVAIKVLEKIGNPKDARRFLREARIIASLQHRNIVTIHDVGTVSGRYYIAMEYLEGGALTDRIGQGMSPVQALDLLESMAACLDFVHRRNIVHGDIKPENILFHPDGTPKLSDFGIAERGGGRGSATKDGRAYGSPHYLSPERAEDGTLDGRSDIYGLGIVFYQMLTGRLPYAEETDVETIVAHLSKPIPLLPEACSACQHLLEQMIAKRPQDRVANAGALLEQVRQTRAAIARGRGIVGTMSRRLPTIPALKAPKLSARGPLVAAAAVPLFLVFGLIGLRQGVDPDLPTVNPPVAEVAPVAGPQTLPVESPPVWTATDEQTGGASPTGTSGSPGPAADETPADSFEPAASAKAISGPHGLAALSTAEETSGVEKAEAAPQAIEGSEAVADTATQPRADGDEVPGKPSPPDDDPDSKIASSIQAAEQALTANRLTTPAGDNAYSHYRQVLALVPDHAEAHAGLERIADRYAAMARRALDNDKVPMARLYVRRGIKVRGKHRPLLDIRAELKAADRLAAAAPQPAVAVVQAPAVPAPVETVIEFEGTSVTSRGAPGTGNIIKDFKNVWRSVFN